MKPIRYNNVRSTASLAINSQILSKDGVSRRLALTPDYAHNPGDLLRGTSYRCRETDWGLRSQLDHNAPLAEHLLGLVRVLDSKREAIRSLRDIKETRVRFSCALINDDDSAATFEIPASVITWCSELLEIDIMCMPRRGAVDHKQDDTPHPDIANLIEASALNRQLVEPDHAFAYLVATPDPVLEWPLDSGNAPAGELLPRPSVAAPLVVLSDLLEDAAASEHLRRVLDLWRTEGAKTAPRQLELTCLYAAERVFAIQEQLLPRAGGPIKLELPLLRQLAELGASFRIKVYPTPSELKRLRELR
jgi:hypothetical protein